MALVLVAVAGELTNAHHYLIASYLLDRTVVIEGTVAEFLYRSPHSFVQIEVADQAGQVEIRTAEWGGGGQLARAGVTQASLKPGDHVVVTGNPSRNPAERRVRMVRIVRPSDGWKWSETDQQLPRP